MLTLADAANACKRADAIHAELRAEYISLRGEHLFRESGFDNSTFSITECEKYLRKRLSEINLLRGDIAALKEDISKSKSAAAILAMSQQLGALEQERCKITVYVNNKSVKTDRACINAGKDKQEFFCRALELPDDADFEVSYRVIGGEETLVRNSDDIQMVPGMSFTIRQRFCL